jgi:hypothetical protein
MSDKISDHLLKLPLANINFTARTPFIPNKSRTSRIAQNYTSQSSLDLIPERDTYRNILEEQHPSNGIDQVSQSWLELPPCLPKTQINTHYLRNLLKFLLLKDS